MTTLITASLRSWHTTILNDAIQMWNRKFGCSEMLNYPDDLRSALLNLKMLTEVETPGLPDEQSQQVGAFSKRDAELSNHSNPRRPRLRLFNLWMKCKQMEMKLDGSTSH